MTYQSIFLAALALEHADGFARMGSIILQVAREMRVHSVCHAGEMAPELGIRRLDTDRGLEMELLARKASDGLLPR
jgi:hypothetical protein